MCCPVQAYLPHYTVDSVNIRMVFLYVCRQALRHQMLNDAWLNNWMHGWIHEWVPLLLSSGVSFPSYSDPILLCAFWNPPLQSQTCACFHRQWLHHLRWLSPPLLKSPFTLYWFLIALRGKTFEFQLFYSKLWMTYHLHIFCFEK